MIKEFATEFSFLKAINEDAFTIHWFKNGNVLLKIKEEPFLFFHSEEKKGFSKSISKNGNYGNAWNENKYQEILK